jgi:hypothetical protein
LSLAAPRLRAPPCKLALINYAGNCIPMSYVVFRVCKRARQLCKLESSPSPVAPVHLLIRVTCLSAPFGRVGFFYDAWTSPSLQNCPLERTTALTPNFANSPAAKRMSLAMPHLRRQRLCKPPRVVLQTRGGREPLPGPCPPISKNRMPGFANWGLDLVFFLGRFDPKSGHLVLPSFERCPNLRTILLMLVWDLGPREPALARIRSRAGSRSLIQPEDSPHNRPEWLDRPGGRARRPCG